MYYCDLTICCARSECVMTSGQSVVSCAVCSVFQMTGQLVDSFLECVTRHVHILNATVAVKQDFADIVESQDNLRLIHLPSWAGLGAVQYVMNYFCMT